LATAGGLGSAGTDTMRCEPGGALAEVTILRFRWDANNSAHCAARNVWDDDFEDALESGEWSLVPNKRGMAATHLFIFLSEP
jgi:hypothetical protein